MAYKSRTCHNLMLQKRIYTLWGGKWEEKGRRKRVEVSQRDHGTPSREPKTLEEN